jgi:hypothetical protein
MNERTNTADVAATSNPAEESRIIVLAAAEITSKLRLKMLR